jgi:hypothetical protein
MEDKLAAERGKQQALLDALHDEIEGSHRQVANLARSVGAVMSDLDRLNQRVASALAAYEAGGTAADAGAAANSVVASNPPSANGTGSLPGGRVGTGSLAETKVGTGSLASVAVAAAPAEPEPLAALDADESHQPADDVADELGGANSFANEFNLSDIAAAVEEQQAMLDAAEQQLDQLEDSIDLSAMADAEAAPNDSAEAEAADAPPVTNGEHRPRPHWLSVTRIGSQS